MPFTIKKKIDTKKIELERQLKIKREKERNEKLGIIRNIIGKEDKFITNFCSSYINQRYRKIYNDLKSTSDIIIFTLTYIFIKLKVELDNIYKKELVYLFFDKLNGTNINKRRRELFEIKIINYAENNEYSLKNIIINNDFNKKIDKILITETLSKKRNEIENKIIHFMTNVVKDKKSIDKFIKTSKFYREL